MSEISKDALAAFGSNTVNDCYVELATNGREGVTSELPSEHSDGQLSIHKIGE